jgi:hypothetical protein
LQELPVSDRVPEDIRIWLRTMEREAPEALDRDGQRQLAEILSGPLMKPVWAALSARLEGMKDRVMSLEMATVDEVAQARAIQAESRGIIVVLELMWEMTNASA